MSHPEDKLAAYVDGELGHAAREKVLAHLAGCADCRAEAEAQRRTKAVLSTAAAPGPSDDLMARLLAVGQHRQPGEPAAPGPAGPGAFARPLVPNPAPGSARPRGTTGPRAGRPPLARRRGARPGVGRRRLTFAAAGAFSMMAVAIGGAFVQGGPATGPDGRPAAPVVERQLGERAAPGLTPAGRVVEAPTMALGHASGPVAQTPSAAPGRDDRQAP